MSEQLRAVDAQGYALVGWTPPGGPLVPSGFTLREGSQGVMLQCTREGCAGFDRRLPYEVALTEVAVMAVEHVREVHGG